jgi:hypothetical protein
MIRGSCKDLWHTVHLTAISFLWKYRSKITLNEESSPLSPRELRLFQRELIMLVQVKLSSFRSDVKSLPIGMQAHMFAFLALLGKEFPGTPVLRVM